MSNKKNIIGIIFLISVSFSLYWQAVNFEFAWGFMDTQLIRNPHFNIMSLESFTYFWKNSYDELYIPISYNIWGLLNIIGIYFFSQVHSPFIYHLANIVLHTVNSILVFILLRRFIKNFYPALAGSLVFLIHPVQIEAIVSIPEFRGLLASLFFFLSILFYIKNCDINYKNKGNNTVIFYIISYICFILGLLSKPSIVVLPFFLILIECFVYNTSYKRLFSKILVWIIPIIAVSISAYLCQKNLAPYSPLWIRPFIFLDSIFFYIYKILCPFSLGVLIYDKRSLPYLVYYSWLYITWIIPFIIGCYLWYIKKKYPLIILSALLFVVGLLPVSSLISFYFQKASTGADRYLYLSMFGVALFLSYTATFIKNKRYWFIVAVIILFLFLRSFNVQIPIWKSNIDLFRHNIDTKSDDSTVNYYIKASFYIDEKI